MKKKGISIDNFVIVNGLIVIAKTDNDDIYEIIKASSCCVGYKVGSFVVARVTSLNKITLRINGKEYFIVNPSIILGYFDIN